MLNIWTKRPICRMTKFLTDLQLEHERSINPSKYDRLAYQRLKILCRFYVRVISNRVKTTMFARKTQIFSNEIYIYIRTITKK